jgi:hypothetical protein
MLALQGCLAAAQSRVHGQEERVLDAGHVATSNVGLVEDAGAMNGGEATQPVRDQGCRCGQGLLGERPNRWRRLKLDAQGTCGRFLGLPSGVVHVLIRRPTASCSALHQAGQEGWPDHPAARLPDQERPQGLAPGLRASSGLAHGLRPSTEVHAGTEAAGCRTLRRKRTLPIPNCASR